MCYHADLGRSALEGVGLKAGEPQNWESLEFRSLRTGGVADSRYTPFLQIWYLAERERSA